MVSPVIRIFFSRASSSRISLKVCKLHPGAPSQPTPIHLAAAVVRIQRIRSLGDCDMAIFIT